MAHGDYHCCAICDSKMSYSSDAETKEHLCSGCVADMAQNGAILHNVEELLEWMQKESKETVISVLSRVGFSKCFYPNRVDAQYLKIEETNGKS